MNAAVLSSWAFDPVPSCGLLFTALLYFLGWRKLHCQVPARYPVWRLAAFFGGLAALFIALASPLDAFASFFLMAHMVQHMLFTMVAPPLLLLGAPQLPLLRGLPRHFVREGLGPFLVWPPLKTLVHKLTHPALCWALFILSNIFWHLPDFYELALRSPGWHRVEHACFFATAVLFWWPVIQPWPGRPRWPRWAMIPYLLLADIQNTALAAFLSFYDRVLYPSYATAPRLTFLSALNDQSGAGAIMWVPGSIAFLVPVVLITIQYLSPKRALPPFQKKIKIRNPQPAEAGQTVKDRAQSGAMRHAIARPLDLLRLPLLRWRHFRRCAQGVLFTVALAIILDGLLGPRISPLNLAGILPWTHWRALTVLALLAVGNLFCMACPFTFVRDLGRRILPASLPWPRALRSKWPAVALLVLYLWAYEAFDLWDNPAATAWIILGYFLAALLVDGFFRGASFCKFVCPVGQFHFVQSLASPFEVKVRQPDICASCRTFDCIKGNATHRGCELKLFQPRKAGNMDCTFCLDCVSACPHGNVGLLAIVPGHDLIADPARSSVGRYAKRPDLAALVLVLTFGAFANAAGMVAPVLNCIAELDKTLRLTSDLLVVTLLAALALVVLPATLAGAAALASSTAAGRSPRENLCRFAMALAPLGFGMWLAHFTFHFFTAALAPLPVLQRIGNDLGLLTGEPAWNIVSLAFYHLPALELLLLDIGFLLTLHTCWRIAGQTGPRKPLATFTPWGLLATALYIAGVWIIFQPMEMRGTMSPPKAVADGPRQKTPPEKLPPPDQSPA